MCKSCVILSSLFAYNRQGFDLADCLRKAGLSVRMIQFDTVDDPQRGVYGARFSRPKKPFNKLIVLLNLTRFLMRSFGCGKDVVVCIGMTTLPLGALYKVVFGSRLVYYATEYLLYRPFVARIVRKQVDRYIDVEEHRRERIFSELRLKQPWLIVQNYPAVISKIPQGGSLRKYLGENFGVPAHRKLVVYAGSYQTYSCLENLVEASREFPDDVDLVLMLSWGVPNSFKSDSPHCHIVPGCQGGEFFNWLADADCALLPYEDEADFNVRNCSPQKLFDCFAVGVPFIASHRPIVLDVMKACPRAGLLCDFSDVASIREMVKKGVGLKTTALSSEMRKLHLSKFNYEAQSRAVVDFVVREVAA